MDEKINEIERLIRENREKWIHTRWPDECNYPHLIMILNTETLISYIKDLEGAITGWRIVEMVDKKRIEELVEGIEKVLKWRNLDGDGISDPLRGELYKLIEKEKP